MSERETLRFKPEEIMAFSVAALEAHGVPHPDCGLLADSLLTAEFQGISSHGLMRLPIYCARFSHGSTEPKTEVTVLHEGETTALLDAHNGIGQVAAARAMDLAMEKARGRGLGLVGVRRSNHFGTAAYFSRMACPGGMIGFAATNCCPSMAPWGGRTRLLGNNPISVAIPAGGPFPIILDMAQSVVAKGKLLLAMKEGRRLPPGWAMDSRGEPTEDPKEGFQGLLMPAGGYKGYGLALMVELLTGALTGAGMLDELPLPVSPEGRGEVGHLLGALKVEEFMPLEEFQGRVRMVVGKLKASERREGFEEVLMPGEPEWRREQESRRRGLPLSEELYAGLRELGEKLDLRVPPPIGAL